MVNLDKRTAIAKFRDLDTKIDNIEGEGVAVARHGSDPAMARPVGNVVWWIGSVEPANALAHDVWDDSEVEA